MVARATTNVQHRLPSIADKIAVSVPKSTPRVVSGARSPIFAFRPEMWNAERSALTAHRAAVEGAVAQETVRVEPSTLTVFGVKGVAAGPWRTDPSVAEKILPWHGQMIMPLATLPTRHP